MKKLERTNARYAKHPESHQQERCSKEASDVQQVDRQTQWEDSNPGGAKIRLQQN